MMLLKRLPWPSVSTVSSSIHPPRKDAGHPWTPMMALEPSGHTAHMTCPSFWCYDSEKTMTTTIEEVLSSLGIDSKNCRNLDTILNKRRSTKKVTQAEAITLPASCPQRLTCCLPVTSLSGKRAIRLLSSRTPRSAWWRCCSTMASTMACQVSVATTRSYWGLLLLSP